MDPRKIALSICWSTAPRLPREEWGTGAGPPRSASARVDLVDEGEAALAVHLDDAYGLLHVVNAGELELAKRGLNVDRLHRRAQLGAVTREVGEGQVGALGGIGEDLDSRVALGSELVRVLVVLGLVRAYEVRVGGECVADVPRAGAASALAGGACRLGHGRGVEAVAAKELAVPALLGSFGHDLRRNVAE